MNNQEMTAFKNIHDWVTGIATQNPDLPAVAFQGTTLTYFELNSRANQVADALSKSYSLTGNRVGICLERSTDLMVAILAVLKTGAAYVPFDAEYPAERLAYMAEVSALPVMITSKKMSSKLPKGKYELFFIDAILYNDTTNDLTLVPVSADAAAYILFTSGSTGKPKGVEMPHRALVNLIDWQTKQTSIHKNGRTLQFAPVSFDVHFQEIFSTWCDGGCLYLISDEVRLNVLMMMKFIEEHKIQRLFLPFIALQNLAEAAQNSTTDLSSLQEIITAGEQLQITPALISLFNKIPTCKLYNHYGPTESHVVTSFTLSGKPESWEMLPPIGTEIQNSEVYLLNKEGKLVADGEEGELFLAGACLANGYLNNPELTAERFLENPFSRGEKMYKTGDLAKKLSDGNIQYLGRIDNQVKVRGYRIELGEIEVVLAKYPAVSQIAVTVREDQPGKKKIVAYLVFAGNTKLNVTHIRSFLQQHLPEYMMPSAFVQLAALPKTPSGKVDRKNLPAPDTKRPELGIPFSEPATATQKILAEIWSRVLSIDPIGVHDHFFDLGGNSLLALQSIALLKQEQNIDLSVVKMYQHPTIDALANVIDGVENIASLSEKMKERAASRLQNNNQREPLAVVGMSLRFPGANSPEELWGNLKNNVESISFFNDDELDASIPASLKNDQDYVKARGIIQDAEGFDAAFFNINPNVAKVTDPQHRVFLELAWNALENSGYMPHRYNGLIGVFAGTGNNTYYQNNVIPHPEAIDKVGSFLTMTNNEKDYIATRVAYELNLKGLAVSVHTACSTSLTAIAQASESLWNHQCDMALAGGVAITCPVNSGQRYEEGAMYSNDGHTRAFDADARGTVFSDGAGIVVLKRYHDAIADGDTIYALVRGVALNNDGAGKSSFTAPSVDGQAAVISMAQAMAGVDARSISYVETHGTATPLGDPIEIEGLTKAFSENNSDKHYCAIGSIKTNIGHLTAAAGVAGFIKTVLSLYHKKIPATIHYKKPNPQIPFNTTPFYVNDKFTDWETDQLPRRAGVSSFGVGGTNAHVILEEAPSRISSGEARAKQLLFLSAKTETALQQRITDLKNKLISSPENLADISYTLQTGRASFPFRFFSTATDTADAIQQLTQPDTKRIGKQQLIKRAGGVAFMFPGQGSQYVGMGSGIYKEEIVFREAVDRCAIHLLPLLKKDLRELLFAEEGHEEAETLLKQTFYTQPALFTIGYALSQLWMSWGIKPAALIGHSIGEFVAATLAGVFSLEDGLTLVATRSKLMQDLPGGSMLSVGMPAAELEKILPAGVAIAAINGARLCVASGETIAIKKLQQQLEEKEVICKLLHTSHAFHSPMMDPIVAPFETFIKTIRLSAPVIPVLSTVTNNWLTDQQATDPLYWAGHLRATVKFAGGVKSLWESHPDYLLLELGPRNTATTLARQQSSDPKTQKAIPSLGDTATNGGEWTNILNAIGQLWLNGIDINWNNFYAFEKRNRIALPGYPFEHKRFWLDPVLSPQNNFNNSTLPEVVNLPGNEINTTTFSNTNTLTVMNNRKESLITELRELLEEASGIEMNQADAASNFIEIGLDSLFLTQIALQLTKKYNVKITFRQLNEDLSSLDSLSSYLVSQLPEQSPQPAIQNNQPQTPIANPAVNSFQQQGMNMQQNGNANMQWLITQQMQMLQQQLQMMQAPGMNPVPPVAMPMVNEPLSSDELQELKKPFGAVARIEKSSSNQFNEKQQRWLEAFIKAYNEKTKKSKAYTQEHRSHLADPRVVTGFRPHLKEVTYQPVVDRSSDATVTDIDGNIYIDVLNGFGSNMFGHQAPFILRAINEQLQKGYELGPQHNLAGEVAKMICEFTGFDRAGFCNTGSEAVLGAMRIARTVTGRNTIVSFNGSYHGINDEVILRGTKKLTSVPAAAGIPPDAVKNMLVLDYGTAETLEIIRQRAHEFAAVIVEPIQSRRADFHPKEFLQELRKITEASGTLLLFDEVITGFRIAPGGAQEYFDVKADVATYGKVVGGGMPIGVIAGKRAYMDALDGGFWQYGDASVPEIGVTYFAGTFVRHPFALAAAKASLLHMKEKGAGLQQELNNMTTYLVTEVNSYCDSVEVPFHLVQAGSLFKPKYHSDLSNADLIYLLLRYNGIHIYDGFPCFLTEAHTKNIVDKIINCFKETIEELVSNGFLHGRISESTSISISESAATQSPNGNETINPPVAGARQGANADGSLAWFVPDPQRPGKFLKVNLN